MEFISKQKLKIRKKTNQRKKDKVTRRKNII